jgi:NAD(P)-dependent dehydrogenase (short-subunit alcohol dehydrogenase family)
MNAKGIADDSPLAGQHALVTGGNRGIGAAIVLQLLRLGADITISGRDRARLTASAADLTGRYPARKVAAVVIDVADAASVATGSAEAAAALGAVTILVNNAGIAKAAPFGKTDLSFWDDILRTDLTGPFLCAKAVLPGMLRAGFGRIVNIASTAGLTGLAYCSAYCAAKHGLVGLTRSLARELAKTPVTVNAVCPGYTNTAIVDGTIANITAKTGRSRDEALADLVAQNPQGRLIEPEEVAAAVGWLCLPASASITGQSIAVAGGELM